MGQKVNPIGFRLPLTRDWQSRWYAEKGSYGDLLQEDLQIRDYISKQLAQAAISRVNVERFANRVRITIHSARPGLVIGPKGSKIDQLKNEVAAMCNNREVFIDLAEVKTPELDPQLVAENITQQLERRVSFRRACKRAIQTSMDMGAEGVRIRVAGRLGGSELARTEQYRDGKVPLHTLRADVSLGFSEAYTMAGTIGVKVWICRPPQTTEES